MNDQSSIVVKHLSKRYRLGQFEPYKTMRDSIVSTASSATRGIMNRLRSVEASSVDPDGAKQSKSIWALRDVSFEVPDGEVVGVVGRNGAGKSTLLKVISRITEPTEGSVTLRGRVGSLLEVGTGFHPELTGRENVYLNGIILGMKKAEIDEKFDHIVGFAGVERFIETPVKRFSTGMKLRLGFAVAAYLEPDILIVDEVLAVGDSEFQKKCIARMNDVARAGRTVLFVSHNLSAIQRLYDNSILMEQGQLKFYGDTHTCLSKYEESIKSAAAVDLETREDRSGSGEIRMSSITIRDSVTGHFDYVQAGNSAEITVRAKKHSELPLNEPIVIRMSVFDPMMQVISHISTLVSGDTVRVDSDDVVATCQIKSLALNVGRYTFSASIGTEHSIFDYLSDIHSFQMVHGSFYDSGRLPEPGMFPALLEYSWKS